MSIKIKNLQTGEFEKFNIPALKGEKGEPGEVEPSEKVDYTGKQHSKLRDTMNANVDYIIKTATDEFNYLDYEGQHITATNSIEGYARSAILSGQTLVNIANKRLQNKENTATNGGTSTNYGLLLDGIGYEIAYPLIANKEYLIIEEWNIKSSNNIFHTAQPKIIYEDDTVSYLSSGGNLTTLGVHKLARKFIPEKNVKNFYFGLTNKAGNTVSLALNYAMIVEYQEGMENWDIPYFTGMASCKMPILSTVGKNLFNYKNYDLKVNKGQNPQEIIVDEQGLSFNVDTASWKSLWYDLYLESGEKYTLSYNTNLLRCFIFKSKVNTYVSSELVADTIVTNATEDKIQKVTKTFTAPSTGFIRIRLVSEQKVGNHILQNFQIEKSSSVTTYEPYKSNILHAPEEVVLRSLPNGVKDTLNLNTGEYVQRIGEVVLDGSEQGWTLGTNANWYADGDTFGFYFNDFKLAQGTSLYIDKFLSTPSIATNDMEGCYISTQWSWVGVRIYKTKLPSLTVDAFKQWLSQNPITVQYELATESIKTVDLSDNHVYSYKGTTHYDCSSAEGSLVPTLSVKVPTDTQLTIQEEKATTQTLLIKNMDLQQSIKEVQAMNLAFNTALYNSFNSIREEVEDIKKHVSTNENLEGSF